VPLWKRGSNYRAHNIRLSDVEESKVQTEGRVKKWPTSKRLLITRYYKEFSKFINSIPFEKINAERN